MTEGVTKVDGGHKRKKKRKKGKMQRKPNKKAMCLVKVAISFSL